MKKLTEQEIRVPNEDRNPRADTFNRELFNYLQNSNWTSQAIQKRIVAVINSIILTGKENVQSQSMIAEYLERGLDVLNVEIQRIEVDPSQKRVVQVDPDEVEDPTVVEENTTRKTRSILKKIHGHLDIIKEDKNLAKELKLFLEACKKREQYLKEQEEEKESEEEKEAPAEEVETTEDNETYLKNYRTFMNNFLGIDKRWTDKSVESTVNLIERFVKNLGGETRKQALTNIELRNLLSVFQRTLGEESEMTGNAVTARDEIMKYAVSQAGWPTDALNVFINNIFSLINTTKSSASVNILLKKLNEIYSKVS